MRTKQLIVFNAYRGPKAVSQNGYQLTFLMDRLDMTEFGPDSTKRQSRDALAATKPLNTFEIHIP